MNWIIIAIVSHFLTAIVYILDKIVVSKTVIRPIIYSFYIGIFGGFTILLAPFGFELMPLKEVIISFIAGILFIFAILYFYKAIKIYEVSKVIPIIGGATAFFTLILSYFFLEERLNFYQFLAFLMFVFGGIIIFWPKRSEVIINIFSFKYIFFILLPAFLFASSYVLTKLIFEKESFINGFIWIRLGSVLGSCLLLISYKNREKIFKTGDKIKLKIIALPVISKLLSAFSFILLNCAIFLGKVSLVNALQGIQYAFILIIAFFFSVKFPKIIREEINKGSLFKKIAGILFICLGLVFLTL